MTLWKRQQEKSNEGLWSYGGLRNLHSQVLERALVPGTVGGSEPHPVDVPGCECLPADVRKPRRARHQTHAAKHDYYQPLSGLAVAMEWDDGVGGVAYRPLDQFGTRRIHTASPGCREAGRKYWEGCCYERGEAITNLQVVFIPSVRISAIVKLSGAEIIVSG